MWVRLTIRAGAKVISWEVDEWDVLVALGTLSAEPESMAEFWAAVRRYQPSERWEGRGQPAVIEESIRRDQCCCLIDLDSRSVYAAGEFELPAPCDAYTADDEPDDGFSIVWIDVPADWLMERAGDDWMSVVERRARSRAGQRRVDTRAVLFGRPVLEFIAGRVVAASAENAGDDTNEKRDQARYDKIRAIHAEWLMTARDDLLGRTPREVLLRKQNHIGLDIQHRADQWSRQGFAPPALSEDSAAYRFGGYGTTEIVLYFELMRSLLGAAWEWAVADRLPPDALFERLVAHRDEYLNQPPEDGGLFLTCGELIESERRRMPIASDGSHLDCDCPVCQAEADGAFGAGPMFMFYDGHHLELEDEFAFSMTESREEWEKEQAALRRFSDEMERKQAEREAGGEPPESVWTSSYVDWDNAVASGRSSLSAKLAMGFLLAEIVTELRDREEGREHIDALNAAFTQFRRAVDGVTEASTAEELRHCLENVARDHPDLIPRSADLQSRLDEVLRAAPDLLDS